jgi:hypothetical protein
LFSCGEVLNKRKLALIPSYLIQPSDKVISYFAKPSYHNSINAMYLLVELIVLLLFDSYYYTNNFIVVIFDFDFLFRYFVIS